MRINIECIHDETTGDSFYVQPPVPTSDALVEGRVNPTTLSKKKKTGDDPPQSKRVVDAPVSKPTDSAAPASSKFRPLALLNADYKLLAATLAARMSLLLPQLIDELQTGFVPGRLIMENITFNRDLLDYAAEEQLPVYMAFLDFEKAFDRVSWEFRDEVMKRMNFPPSFITAISGLYHNSTNSLLVNSSITRVIEQTRGVRQGCPLSPFLFALFAEPLGLLLRSLEGPGPNRPVCGVAIPTLKNLNGDTRHIVASQFADDTTVYATSSQALRYTLSLIQSEFCLASGAKLNPTKTRTLCGGSAPPPSPPQLGHEPWQEMDIMLLQGNDTLKSLGAVYSTNIPPESRFDAIIEKIQHRMMRWQSRHPSLMARVLIANTLLSSCIWFFAYFLVPTDLQLQSLDAVVWGMIWGKQRGALGTRGAVNRQRLALPPGLGGLNVIIPSVMIRAIRVNMVNRALLERGRWWSSFFYYWAVKAESGLFRGADSLTQQRKSSLKGLVQRHVSIFWAQAIKDWTSLKFSLPAPSAPSAPHREHAGSYPVLAAVVGQRDRANLPPAAKVLVQSGLIYLADFWNFSTLQWHAPQLLVQATQPARQQHQVPLPHVLALIHRLQRHVLANTDHVEALEQSRETQVPPEHPSVGSIWADPTVEPMVVGTIVKVVTDHTGPLNRGGLDRNQCGCTEEVHGVHGICVWLHPLHHQEGFGTTPLPPPPAVSSTDLASCSCCLSPVTVLNESMWGALHFTRLIPPLLRSEVRLPSVAEDDPPPTLDMPIRTLRRTLLHLQQPPSFPTRPPAELKWVAELGFHNLGVLPYERAKTHTSVAAMSEAAAVAAAESAAAAAPPPPVAAVAPSAAAAAAAPVAGPVAPAAPAIPPPLLTQLLATPDSEWSARWRALSSVHLSGPTRSFMWRLTHRSLHLLSASWYARYHQRDQMCLLCTQRRPETYSHLFSDCPTASLLWDITRPLLVQLRANLEGDLRPARLLGDLSIFPLHWRMSASWPEDGAARPSADRFKHLVRMMWTEIRAIVLKAIWEARCDILHANIPTRDQAIAQARTRIKSTLRTLAYQKLPSLLPGILASRTSGDLAFYNLTWGATTALQLLLPRHQPPPPSSPPPPAPGSGV